MTEKRDIKGMEKNVSGKIPTKIKLVSQYKAKSGIRYKDDCYFMIKGIMHWKNVRQEPTLNT